MMRFCYSHLLSKQFLDATSNIHIRELPGTRLYDMKMECFKQMAAKCKSVDEVNTVSVAIFPADQGPLVQIPALLNGWFVSTDPKSTPLTAPDIGAPDQTL